MPSPTSDAELAPADHPAASPIPASLDGLTPRELQILTLIARGFSLAQIAEQLGRSQKTVETHRLALGRKLHANNRVQLARIGIAHGLAPLPQRPNPNTPQAPRDPQPYTGWDLCRAMADRLGSVSGRDYFAALTHLIVDHLHPRIVAVCDAGSDHRHIRVLAGLYDGQPLNPGPYNVEDFPCRHVLDTGSAALHDHPRTPFPDPDPDLQTQTTDYLGVALRNPQGHAIGLILIACDQPFAQDPSLHTALHLAAARAGAELTHLRLTGQLQSLTLTSAN
ncbi:MAG: response regulator transcription factor [Planctomycetota bacterium]